MKQDNKIDFFVKKYIRNSNIKYLKIPYSLMRFLNVNIKLSKGKGIIVFSLPKSGSSWLESMLSDYYRIPYITFPDSTIQEIINGNSHTLISKAWHVKFVSKHKCLYKTHSKYSYSYGELFEKYKITPIIITRNMFSVIKSHILYVKKTPYHPEYKYYKDMSPEKCIDLFIQKYLIDWVLWEKSWDELNFAVIKTTYENLRMSTYETMFDIIHKLDGSVNKNKLLAVIEKNDSTKRIKNEVSFFNEGRINPDFEFFNPKQIKRINNYLKK